MKNPTLTLKQFVAAMQDYLAENPEHAHLPMEFYNSDPTPFFQIEKGGRYIFDGVGRAMEPALLFSGSMDPDVYQEGAIANRQRYAVQLTALPQGLVHSVDLTVNPNKHNTESLIDLAVKTLWGQKAWYTAWYGDEDADGAVMGVDSNFLVNVKINKLDTSC